MKRFDIIIANKDYPLDAKINYYKDGTMWLDLSEVTHERFLLSPPRPILGKTARHKFRELNMKLNSTNQNCTAEMATALATEGLGIAFTCRSCYSGNPNWVKT